MNQQSTILILNPTLAESVGLNESIVLQQLYYWHSKYNFEKLIYNTYENWQKQFKFWSIRTIRRIFKSLEEKGFIKCTRTKSYKLYQLCLEKVKKFFPNSDCPKSPPRVDKMDTPYTKITTKTNKNNIYLSPYPSLSSKKNQEQIKEKPNKGEKIKKITQEFSAVKLQQETKQIVKQEEIALNMVKTWNRVFEQLENPIKAYAHTKLTRLYKTKFTSNLDEWQAYAKKVVSSKFLMGEKKDFKASFSWLLKEDIIDAILNDEYGVGDKIQDIKQDAVTKKMVEIWKSHISSQQDSLILTKHRTKKLVDVFKKHFKADLSEWQKFICHITKSEFLMGNRTGFKIFLDWAIREDKIFNIKEGNYHSRDEWQQITTQQRQKKILQDLESNVDSTPEWRELLKESMKILGTPTYVSWISKLKLDSFQNGILRLKTNSSFIRDYIDQHYSKKLLNIAGNYFVGIRKLCLFVSDAAIKGKDNL